MRLIPTFCDGNFHGFDTMKEITRLKKDAYELALFKQEEKNADHMIYGFFDYNNDGQIVTARLYSGIPKTDDEFYSVVALIQNAQIYAIHKK